MNPPRNFAKKFAARHKDTPEETLVELSTDNEWTVREAVAENPSTPPETLAELGKDPWDKVKLAVARNPSTPPETLAELTTDPHPEVSSSAIENLKNQVAELITDEDVENFVNNLLDKGGSN